MMVALTPAALPCNRAGRRHSLPPRRSPRQRLYWAWLRADFRSGGLLLHPGKTPADAGAVAVGWESLWRERRLPLVGCRTFTYMVAA